MKIIHVFLFLVLNLNYCAQSQTTPISNVELDNYLKIFKNDYYRYQFSDYYLNNFQCSICDGGWIDFTNGKTNKCLWSYKGVDFNGIVGNASVNSTASKFIVYCRWKNNNKIGTQDASIQIEYYLNKKNESWNSIIRMFIVNTEMVAYLKLTDLQEQAINNFIENSISLKNQREIDYKLKLEAAENKRKIDSAQAVQKKFNDSIFLIKRKYEDSVLLVKKKIKDSLAFVYAQKLEVERLEKLRKINVGDSYLGGIVVYKDESNVHGLVFSPLIKFSNNGDMEIALKKQNWRLPNNSNIKECKLFRKLYHDKLFRLKITYQKSIKTLRLIRHCSWGCNYGPYESWIIRPFNLISLLFTPVEEKMYFFGVKEF